MREAKSTGSARSALMMAAFWREKISEMPFAERSSMASIWVLVKTASSPAPWTSTNSRASVMTMLKSTLADLSSR